ncbi:serine hydrolase [Oceanibium sediminis]|uniref:serine hydrolase n=1 Tax=Oceanibium sediminis TaxID=2026339 RepID=UPI000DD3F585|nr:serine hydrolase [Oceanibium sediminis]
MRSDARGPRPFLRAAAVLLALLPALALPAQAEGLTPQFALPEPATAPPLTVLFPVPQARIDAAIDGLDDLAAETLERTGIPGLAIAVVQGGETVYARGFGTRSVDGDAPVDADTVFMLASVSKSLGATVVATQVSAGRVSWDDPVRRHLPSFDMGDDWVSDHVTIGDLYAHRSGLPDHAGDDLEDIGYDRRAVMERLSQLPKGRFRLDYAYTNFGMTAAAEAVATAAGTDWASLSEAALYEPLGMTSTSSRHADYMARSNRAASHVPERDGFAVSDRRQPDAQSPAGGVSSSVRDMALWMRMVLAGGTAGPERLVSEEALLPALSPQAISGSSMQLGARTSTYGYGFNVGTRPSGRVVLSHSGAFALGASASFSMIPDLDLGIVVLSNALPVGAPEAISATFLDRAELGVAERDWLAAYRPFMTPLSAPFGELHGATPLADPAPAQPAAAYAGRYENTYFGPATVSETEDGLVLSVGPRAEALRMTHWDGDSFVVHPMTENQPAGSVSRVSFGTGASGVPLEMRVEHLDGEGLGLFRRQE